MSWENSYDSISQKKKKKISRKEYVCFSDEKNLCAIRSIRNKNKRNESASLIQQAYLCQSLNSTERHQDEPASKAIKPKSQMNK